MRSLLLVLVFAMSVGQAEEISPFEQIAYEDPATGFKFAQMVSSYRFQQRVDYGDARLGYGIEYLEITGTTASIIVYDLGLQAIPDGTNDSKVLEEFKKVDQSIAALVQRGQYKSAAKLENFRPLSKAWLQASHEIKYPDGRTVKSYSFMRGQNGKFVKIRISATSEGTYARLPGFILGMTRAVGLLR